jgi:hypothetical protein
MWEIAILPANHLSPFQALIFMVFAISKLNLEKVRILKISLVQNIFFKFGGTKLTFLLVFPHFMRSYKFIHNSPSFYTHSFITVAEFRSSFLIADRSGRGPPLGCLAEIRTRDRHKCYQLSHAAPRILTY